MSISDCCIQVSVVSPVYGCNEGLLELCQRLKTSLECISANYEIILVNDASPDESWNTIRDLAAADPRVKGINLSRNFGQHRAITAGLDHASGEWVVVMDCDLQDVPEEIPKLYAAAQLGYDIVVGRRVERMDTWLKKFLSRAFHQVFSYFTERNSEHRIANFGIYSKKAISGIRSMREQHRAFSLFASWVGYRRLEIDVQHAIRPYGQSSYNFTKAFNFALDNILTHSDRMLRITVRLGLLMSLVSFSYAAWMILRYFLWATPVMGWTSLIVSIYLSTGLIIGALGIVGLYVGKIFDEVKRRPLYLIESTTFDGLDS
ncbi:MAG: glycosyltransferase family 2 protein [Candidatus Sericytochromatia bacterium]|nr:glycosyltransferase family 2 protein [Candidatus Sericytochromatia bacterium]